MTKRDRFILFQKVILGLSDKKELIQELKSDFILLKDFEATLDAEVDMFKDIPIEVRKTILKWKESVVDALVKEKGENFTDEELHTRIIEFGKNANGFSFPASLLN